MKLCKTSIEPVRLECFYVFFVLSRYWAGIEISKHEMLGQYS